MTDPATPFIRPMSLAELLDRAIGLYRRNFVKFIGVIAVPYIPLVVLQTGISFLTTSSLTQQLNDPTGLSIFNNGGYWLGVLGSLVVVILQFFLVQGVATAALTRAVADSYTGKPVGILDAYRNLHGSWFRLILALVLIMILFFVILVWLIIPCVGWFTGIGILVFFGLAVFPLVSPVVVLENRDPALSIRRAWELARSRFWWMVGFVFVLYLFGQLVITGPTMLINLVMQSVLSVSPNPFGQQLVMTTVIQSLVTMISGLLYLPLQLVAITVVYFDLRVRSEGLDLALQASNTSSTGADAISMPEISAVSQKSLITWAEIGYFFLLSIAALAVYFLFAGLLVGLMFATMPHL
jgi:hypothetical protein